MRLRGSTTCAKEAREAGWATATTEHYVAPRSPHLLLNPPGRGKLQTPLAKLLGQFGDTHPEEHPNCAANQGIVYPAHGRLDVTLAELATRCIPSSQVQHVETVTTPSQGQSSASRRRTLGLQSLWARSPLLCRIEMHRSAAAPQLPRVLYHPPTLDVAPPRFAFDRRTTPQATERQEHSS